MHDPIQQLCSLLLEKAQAKSDDELTGMVSEVLRELEQNQDLSQSLRQDLRLLQINMGQSKGYQVLVETNATAYIGDQYHFDSDAVIQALGKLLDEFSKKQSIVGTPNNLPRSGAIAFVGRDDLLTKLDEQLQSNERIGITGVKGMGGIGKTELALQYAIASYNESKYPGGVCWLQARDQEIATQIINFARVNLGINPPDDMEADEQVRFTWQRWQQGNSLIILDDVTDYNAIAPSLPPSDPRFKVLITTRNNLGAAITQIEIEALSDAAAIALLKSIIGDERVETQKADAEALCRWVGNLPLGLELLGRFLVRKDEWNIDKLLKRLESKKLEAKALVSSESGMTASLGVAAALELSWTELDDEEKDLSRLLGMFAVAPITWTLVEKCFEEKDYDDLEDYGDALRDRSLLKRVGQGEYQLHQIIQEYFRSKLQENGHEEDRIKPAFIKMMLMQAKTVDDSPTLAQVEHIRSTIPHLEEIAQHWLDLLPEKNKILPFIGISRFYEWQGNYNLAEPWYLKCYGELKKSLGDEHLDVIKSLNNLALLYNNQGRYEEAEPLYLETLELRKKLSGPENLDVANTLNHLATLYENQGRYEEAESLFLEALEVCTKLLGREHLDVTSILNNLAHLYENQGRFKEAETLYLETLEVCKKLLGTEHLDVASILHNLAHLYENQGRYEDAESLLWKVLEVCKKLLGTEHIYISHTLNNLAMLYDDQGRYQEAESLYLEALEMRKMLLGTAHPSVASSLNNLAVLHDNQGHYQEAESLYLKALEMRKKIFGTEHPIVASTFHNLAGLYDKQGRYEEAESLFLKALEVCTKLLGFEHPDVAGTLNNLAKLYEHQGRYEEAESLFLEALEMRKKLLGSEHPHVALTLNNLAELYEHQGRYKEAESLFLEALEMRKKLLGSEHPDVVLTLNNLAKLYEHQRR